MDFQEESKVQTNFNDNTYLQEEKRGSLGHIRIEDDNEGQKKFQEKQHPFSQKFDIEKEEKEEKKHFYSENLIKKMKKRQLRKGQKIYGSDVEIDKKTRDTSVCKSTDWIQEENIEISIDPEKQNYFEANNTEQKRIPQESSQEGQTEMQLFDNLPDNLPCSLKQQEHKVNPQIEEKEKASQKFESSRSQENPQAPQKQELEHLPFKLKMIEEEVEPELSQRYRKHSLQIQQTVKIKVAPQSLAELEPLIESENSSTPELIFFTIMYVIFLFPWDFLIVVFKLVYILFRIIQGSLKGLLFRSIIDLIERVKSRIRGMNKWTILVYCFLSPLWLILWMILSMGRECNEKVFPLLAEELRNENWLLIYTFCRSSR